MSDPHHDASDYKHGEMDIHQHVSTYNLFGALTKWGSLHLAVLLVFLVLLTCTSAGWMTALISAVIVGVVGWFMLKKKPDASH
ncbi:MAG: aa3-type cytochrome c oxidase subunit IV [Asticcacaulis sp.]